MIKGRGRSRRNDGLPHKKHDTSGLNISSTKNSDPTVEFVDCCFDVDKLNACADVTFKTSEFDKAKNFCMLESILSNKNVERRYNNTSHKRRRQMSVRFVDEDRRYKKIRLDKNNSSNTNDTRKLNSSTLCFQEDSNQSTLNRRRGRKKVTFDNGKKYENHDNSEQIISYEKSSGNDNKGIRVTEHMVFLSEPDHLSTYQQSQHSISTSKSRDQLSDIVPITVPLPIKSENIDETDLGGGNKVIYLSKTALPNNNHIKYDERRQLEVARARPEEFTEMCVSINDDSICNENMNNQISLAADFLSNDSPQRIHNDLLLMDTFLLNNAEPNIETITTTEADINNEITKQKELIETDFIPIISAVHTVSEIGTQTQFSDPLSISVKSETELLSQSNEESVTDRMNKVTDSDTNRFAIESQVSLLPKSEKNGQSMFSTLGDCITIEDDDEVIELTDSEELINCDEEIVPVNHNDNNKSKETWFSSLELDENSRCSVNSNTSEELVDLDTESGNIVVFDGVNSIQLGSEEESVTKTDVAVGDAIASQGNVQVATSHEEVIIFDDINDVESKSFEDVTPMVENNTSDYFINRLFGHSDQALDKLIVPSINNANSFSNKATTNSNIMVDLTSDDKVQSSFEDSRIGKIRVKNLSNLGVSSPEEDGNSSKKDSEKQLIDKPATGTELTEPERSDLLSSLRKAIWNSSGFSEEEKQILRLYKRYFDDRTEEIVRQMGQIIHLAVSDNLNYIKYNEQMKKLLTGGMVITETLKAQSFHNTDILTHGTSFVKYFKEILCKLSPCDVQDMVFIILFRAFDAYLRVDAGNKKYYAMARDVLREMLAKVNYDKCYNLDDIISMDTNLFLKRYNGTIKLISRYYGFVTQLREQFRPKLTEGEATNSSNVQLKQNTLDSFINLKNSVLQEQQGVSYTTTMTLSPPSNQPSTALLEKSKPLVKGVLLLNGENMTKVTNLSVDELLQLNKQVYINPKQKYFLQCYKKYFIGTTEDKLLQLAELLHVITCEMLCQHRKLESIRLIPRSSFRICEEEKLLAVYKNNLKRRGFDFIQLMKGITNKFHGHCFARMVCALYCRVTEMFLKLDINNIKYFVVIREIVKKMLELNDYSNKDLFELLVMKEEDFVRSYNSVIHMLLVYYELVKSAEPQNENGAGNNSGSVQSTTTPEEVNMTSEGNIIIPLNTQAVEVPVIKRISKNSILIV